MKNYIVYQITNRVDDKIYIGCHITKNINDSYMGSGTNIKKAIDEFGKENFDKIILYNFDNKSDMLEKESKLVNREFIKRDDTYNIIIGGTFNTVDTIMVRDESGDCMRVHKSDKRYLSGKLVGITKGMTTVKNSAGEYLKVNIDDDRYLSGELVGTTKGMVPVKDVDGNISSVKVDDIRYLNGELRYISDGMVTTKDIDGNIHYVCKDDLRFLNGELIPLWKGKKHTKESKRKIGEKNSIHQKGEKNSQYGTCWVYNMEIKKSKPIKKEELHNYLNDGWIKGAKHKWD